MTNIFDDLRFDNFTIGQLYRRDRRNAPVHRQTLSSILDGARPVSTKMLLEIQTQSDKS